MRNDIFQGDEETQKISFGQKLPSMLQLEERQRCDGRRGSLYRILYSDIHISEKR